MDINTDGVVRHLGDVELHFFANGTGSMKKYKNSDFEIANGFIVVTGEGFKHAFPSGDIIGIMRSQPKDP